MGTVTPAFERLSYLKGNEQSQKTILAASQLFRNQVSFFLNAYFSFHNFPFSITPELSKCKVNTKTFNLLMWIQKQFTTKANPYGPVATAVPDGNLAQQCASFLFSRIQVWRISYTTILILY